MFYRIQICVVRAGSFHQIIPALFQAISQGFPGMPFIHSLNTGSLRCPDTVFIRSQLLRDQHIFHAVPGAFPIQAEFHTCQRFLAAQRLKDLKLFPDRGEFYGFISDQKDIFLGTHRRILGQIRHSGSVDSGDGSVRAHREGKGLFQKPVTFRSLRLLHRVGIACDQFTLQNCPDVRYGDGDSFTPLLICKHAGDVKLCISPSGDLRICAVGFCSGRLLGDVQGDLLILHLDDRIICVLHRSICPDKYHIPILINGKADVIRQFIALGRFCLRQDVQRLFRFIPSAHLPSPAQCALIQHKSALHGGKLSRNPAGLRLFSLIQGEICGICDPFSCITVCLSQRDLHCLILHSDHSAFSHRVTQFHLSVFLHGESDIFRQLVAFRCFRFMQDIRLSSGQDTADPDHTVTSCNCRCHLLRLIKGSILRF